MTIHVPVEELQRRFTEVAAAAERGEDVIVFQSGTPPVRLVALERRPPPPDQRTPEQRKIDAEKRISAFGMYAKEFEGWDTLVPPSMTDEEVEARWRRKFGPPD
jgi:prevent-host-death family protein